MRPVFHTYVLRGGSNFSSKNYAPLERERAKHYQAFAWQVGAYYFVWPVPDARTECLVMKLWDEDEREE